MDAVMAVMIAEVYDALKDAGASEEKARRAAETLASYEARFVGVERQLDGMKIEIERLTGRVNLLTWMVGFALAGIMTLIFKAFS